LNVGIGTHWRKTEEKTGGLFGFHKILQLKWEVFFLQLKIWKLFLQLITSKGRAEISNQPNLGYNWANKPRP
jgi:hypothetical protein